ncbi:MAG TPA: hypothetical protein VFU55_13200 [Terracidiphilus sp.]|nr:hypothetical protein [Terracidiphilus sp.]
MASDLESVPSSSESPQKPGPGGWVRMGAVAVASALAAGFAVNWFYRKTLTRLRQAEPGTENPDFQSRPPDDFDDL